MLVKAWEMWYDNSNEANNKAGHGRWPSPMPLCRSVRSYTIAFATPVPIITVFPSFFNSHFLTSYYGGLFHNTGFVSVHMRCGVIISCTAFCLSRRETVRRDAGVKARPVRGHPGEILCPYGRSRREGTGFSPVSSFCFGPDRLSAQAEKFYGGRK